MLSFNMRFNKIRSIYYVAILGKFQIILSLIFMVFVYNKLYNLLDFSDLIVDMFWNLSTWRSFLIIYNSHISTLLQMLLQLLRLSSTDRASHES